VAQLFRFQIKSRLLFSVLLSVAGAILALLAIGTIYAIARPSGSGPLFTFGKSRANKQDLDAPTNDTKVFAGIGRLRIPLSNSSTMILSIAFPYSAADITFTEELAGKIGDFKTIASGYFSSLPEESLINIDEETAKTEILRRYNAILRLGRIQALYFSDLMVIDETR